MTKLGFAERYNLALSDASDMSELWTGTIISDIIDRKKESLVNGVNNGEAEEVTNDLLPDLLDAIDQAQKQYEQQEG